jgi:tetraacyldisaccharide 4'-kinase
MWYEGRVRWLAALLTPLSWLFGIVSALRRAAYRHGWMRSERISRPVIVVGNITVGGTGKTPFVIWLTARLQSLGWQVGIVLRGYAGQAGSAVIDVSAQASWEQVGDEAVLLAQRTGAIVVASSDRVAAANRAVARGADVIVCDDGLQHYRLQRDCEIAVVDARRYFGNGRLLPAGPLRERPARLQRVNAIVFTKRYADSASATSSAHVDVDVPVLSVHSRLHSAVALLSGEVRPLTEFSRAHAIAGIGNPEAFFASLEGFGIDLLRHPLADHARLDERTIKFDDELPVLMTEKDAVKCRGIADARHWAVPLDLEVNAQDVAAVLLAVRRAMGSQVENS